MTAAFRNLRGADDVNVVVEEHPSPSAANLDESNLANEEHQKNVYLYLGSVAIVLGICNFNKGFLFLCMFCCVRRKNKPKKKPKKTALVEEKLDDTEQKTSKETKENEIQFVEMSKV